MTSRHPNFSQSAPVYGHAPLDKPALGPKKGKACHCNVNKQRALSEVSSCVKVEVAVLGSLSLIILMVSVDVK